MKRLFLLLILLLPVPALAQQQDPATANVVPPDVQALQQSLANAGCNAALNAASTEIIKLRRQVAELQTAQMQGKSGATKK